MAINYVNREAENVQDSETGMRFHEENTNLERDPASYKNRISQLYNFRTNIKKLIYRNGFEPSTDYSKFLRLKSKDALGEDVQESNITTSITKPVCASTLSDPEAATIEAAVESMQATEFVQLFLDSYMAPIGSDIDFRLGKVVGIKEYLYNGNGIIYKDHKRFGQYDAYGRIDTTLNLRLRTQIPGLGYRGGWSYIPGKGWSYFNSTVIPGYYEDYVNFFFPPYTLDSFADSTSLSTNVDYYIRTRKWNTRLKKWVYEDDFDPDSVTYDTAHLLSMRKNPTYRLPAYKAINDNISFLQHIFEQCTGIVSTYLTEWDISVYIQEGLLSGKENKAPTYMSLTNRITVDNPSGYSDSRAFVYGALNAAVSKTPMEGSPVPNYSDWIPSAFPYSVYWLGYKSRDRGDGLDMFYDVALGGFNCTNLSKFHRGDGNNFSANHYNSLSFREKIMRDDQIGAAFSGWFNWNTLKYWQALYTTADDGLGSVDIIHMSIDEATSVFENTTDDKGNVIDGVIQQIIGVLYEENDELGFSKSEYEKLENGEKKRYRRNPYGGNDIYMGKTIVDANGDEKTFDANGSEVDGGGDEGSDLKVKGVKIPGSRILKIFLKRSSKKANAMNIANKEKGKGYSSANSSSNNNANIFGNSTTSNANNSRANGSSNNNQNGSVSNSSASNGNNGNPVNGNSAAANTIVSMVDADAAENGKYARDTGVSQWTPALYGGPHGRHLNPRTIEGYFEHDNEFLRNVPRLNPGNLSTSVRENFKGLEDRYSPTRNSVDFADPYRSPSRCKSLLQNGYCDYTLQPIYCLMRHYMWSRNRYGYINGNWYCWIARWWAYETEGTGFLTPVSFMCNPYNNDYYPNCPHYYWRAYYEWDNWNRYAHYYGGSSYWNYWYWDWFYRNDSWRDTYSLSYSKDYWGRLQYLCIWSSERIGRGRYSYDYHYRHYHGNCGVYHLRARRCRYMYLVTYTQWETYYLKRPLMHSNPNASNSSLWNITEGYWYNNVRCKWYSDHWWWRYWSHYSNGMLSRYNPLNSHRTAISIGLNRQNGYRLTFPLSGVKYHNCTLFGPCDIRHKEEMNFLEYVTGHANNGWHNVFFFQSAPGVSFSDRYNNGPNQIFQVSVRRNYYPAHFFQWYLRRERHRCHRDWCWHLRILTGDVPFIEVDMKNVRQVIGGFKQDGNGGVTPWSNLNSLIYANDKQEANLDIPPGQTAQTTLPNSPFGYSTFPVWEGIPTQIWAGIGRDGNEFNMYGWGYATALPGMEYSVPNPPENMFENPNKYMNIQNIYGSGAKGIRMNDISYYYPFYTLDNNAPLMYVVPPQAGSQHNFIRAQGVKRYTRIWNKDPGIRKMLKNIFATSTFFKYIEPRSGGDLSDYLMPRIVTNDIGLRVLIRTANHQLAWLRKAHSILENDVDWGQVRTLIENTVNKTILSKSIPTSSGYDQQSVFYHYWIEKAYNIFKDDSQKQVVLNAFSTRENILDSFIKTMSKYIGLTSYSWSYNDYNYIYGKISELYSNVVSAFGANGGRDNTVEEAFYSYLQVLYEYRKFYINSRCNKVDGTLYRMRELEGAIPLVCQQIQTFDPTGKGVGANIFDASSHTYKVSFYDIDNSNIQKIRTLIDSGLKLQQDRTMLLYLPVKYVSEEAALGYLEKCRNGTNTPADQRFIWVPQKQKYAELPFDDVYRYESKEYQTNEAAKKFNKKVTNYEKRQVREDIDDCIFEIKWADNHILERIQNASGGAKISLRNKLGTGKAYPYVYSEISDWKSRLNVQKNGTKIPMIKFDVQSGVDPSKLIAAQKELQSQPAGTYTAFDIMCSVGSKTDYWVVAIPPSNRPRAVGYVSSLKIKSWRDNSLNPQPSVETSTAAGAFGYSLYPITEEQANTIPGIGLDIAGLQDNLKNSYLNDFDTGIENLDLMN